jgi:acyl carrier protein
MNGRLEKYPATTLLRPEQKEKARRLGCTMDVETIKTEIIELINNEVPVAVEQITEKSLLYDLGVDSLMALKILAMVEKKYRIEIPEEEITKVRTFGDVLTLAKKYLN